MSSTQTVPVTFEVAFRGGYDFGLYIGDSIYSGKHAEENSYWYVVVSRTDLSVVFNEMSTDNSSYPAGLSAYLGDSGFYVFISTYILRSDHLPVGQLFQLMEDLGATSNLEKVLQIANQVGTGNYTNAAYSIAAIADLSKQTVFDQYTFFVGDNLFMPLMFGSIEVLGKTIWTLGVVNS